MRFLLVLLLLFASETGPATLSPDGSLLATGCAAKVVKVWDVRTGRLVRELKGPGPAVTERSFSPDSSYEVEDRIDAVAFDAAGKRLATAGEDGFVRVWSVADGRLLAAHEDGYVVYGVSFSPAGDRVGYINNSTRYLESSVMEWDLATGAVRSIGDSHSGTIAGFRFHPSGTGIMSWGAGTVDVWNGPSWKGGAAAWRPDGMLVAVGRKGSVVLAHPESGEMGTTLALGSEAEVGHLEFSPDGGRLAGVADGMLVVWDTGSGQKLFEKPVRRLFGWTRVGTVAVQTSQGRLAWLDGRTGKALQSAPPSR